MATVLVEDLIPIILDSFPTRDQTELSRCALVSSQWLWYARKRLYACPCIYTYDSCKILANTLRRNSVLRQSMTEIWLGPTLPKERREHFQVDAEVWACLLYIIGSNSLQSVTLGGGLVLLATQLITGGNFTKIRQLHIDGSAFQHIATFYWDRNLASKLSGLTHFTLSKLRLVIAYPTSNIPPLQITHLFFDDVMIFPGDLRHLCHQFWHTVQHLRIIGHTDLDTNDELRATLALCINLRTFEYEARGVWEHGAIYDDRLPVIPSLRKLVLINVPFGPNSLTSVDSSFRGLEELTMAGGRSYRVTLDEWCEMLKGNGFSSMRELTTQRAIEHSPLQDICFNRNILLHRFIS